MTPEPLRSLVVLVSGSGTNLQAVIDAIEAGRMPGVRIAAVGSDRTVCEGLDRARRHGIPTFAYRTKDFPDRAAWDEALTKAVAAWEPDLVLLAGFMKLTGPAFLAEFGGRTVNTHPALLPSFPGMHGPGDAIDYGVKVSGCTLFVVDGGVDTGPIVDQWAVPVLPDDTAASLHERIKVAERAMIVETIGAMLRCGYTITDRKVTIAVSEPTADPTITPDELGRRPIRRALVSVYDKTGIEDLGRVLHAHGVAIVSTGNTAKTLAALGIPVTEVEELTGFPECLEGRVKTLHPAVHAGILADSRKPEHLAQLDDLGVVPFDLVVSNLYPFTATVASGATADECVEQIDIGGPSMVRAAAKNHPSVAIVTDPTAYGRIESALGSGGFTLEERKALAVEAFVHTATYDVAVASWLGSAYVDGSGGTGFPDWVGATWRRSAVLRYGENPHQKAALYADGRPGVAGARQLQGKEMSYNNYVDTDAAIRAALDQGDQPTCAIIKHANPCGIAVGVDLAEAHGKAHACDPVSAYGGVIAVNGEVTAELAEQVKDIFTEVIAAPSFSAEARAILKRKKNLRLLEYPTELITQRPGVEWRPVSGGLLIQQADRLDAVVTDESGEVIGGDAVGSWRLVAGESCDPATLADLEFAWRAVRSVKSNAILLARDGASVGVGMGQVNRVDSCRLAVTRAGAERAAGAVAASDAFFPFPDGLEILAQGGVRAVVAPGGSIRDDEVIAAASAAGVSLYFTGTRHFAH